ncbi:hypothetical protein IV203_029558 [Nitzschia inconspicua]|uniref:Uncharacterized protein n=1 Tax=Nitzschia inconspicua TaxID=303405 RepID=A0A9K3LS02_9STRA|nr:hypothetical protein IV203_029558 [Nitzschia inconspicua]
MKGVVVLAVLNLMLVSWTDAFHPLLSVHSLPKLHATQRLDAEWLQIEMEEPPIGRRDFVAKFAGCIVMSSTLHAVPQKATAEEIKTLDMSLPTYDSINTLKISAASEKALGVENLPEAPSKAAATPRKKKSSSDDGDGRNPLANVLPSMNKSASKNKRPSSVTTTAKSERPSPKRRREEKAEDEIKTMDLSLPSYAEGVQTKEKNAFAL